jgi:hypothetical protein
MCRVKLSRSQDDEQGTRTDSPILAGSPRHEAEIVASKRPELEANGFN